MIAKIYKSNSLSSIQTRIQSELEHYQLHPEHVDVLYILSGEKLGIEQARAIKDHFLLKPYQAKGRGIVVEDLSGITVDAQNALLKVVEEPPEEAVILFGTSTLNHLLPTFLSRCQVIEVEGEERIEGTNGIKEIKEIEEVLGQDTVGRFKFVEKLDDKEGFLQKLLLYMEQQLISRPEYVQFAKETLDMERWHKAHVNARGILEYLMLILPKP
jgi:DNA polymerase III delta prime subunit